MPKRQTKPPIAPRQLGQTYRQQITPEIAGLVGSCIITWSRVEQAIEEVVWALLQIDVDHGRIITARLDAKYKMMLLRQLGNRHFRENTKTSAEFSAVLERLEDLYGERNLMAHGQWVTLIPDNIPAVLSLREKLPKETPRNEIVATTIPQERLEAIQNNMYIISNYLIGLRKRLSKAIVRSRRRESVEEG
jgi:hypothetical protein